MAGYMALIWDDEAAWDAASEQDVEQAMQAHRDFGARYAQALRGGNRLYTSSTATSIRHGRAAERALADSEVSIRPVPVRRSR